MSPRQPRRIVESDDESLPDTWEEMRRSYELVSPAGSEQQQEAVHRIRLSDPPRVITIEDDDNDIPQEAPLGDEPPFEVLISMMDDAPAPPPQPAPEPVPEPEPEPATESPQPGPSCIQESDDNDKYEE